MHLYIPNTVFRPPTLNNSFVDECAQFPTKRSFHCNYAVPKYLLVLFQRNYSSMVLKLIMMVCKLKLIKHTEPAIREQINSFLKFLRFSHGKPGTLQPKFPRCRLTHREINRNRTGLENLSYLP